MPGGTLGVEGGRWFVLLVDGREGGLEGHGVEGTELLRVELLAETSSSVGKPDLSKRKYIYFI